MSLDPRQFAFNLLTRSLRITHDNLKVRDPKFVESIDTWYATQAEKQSGVQRPAHGAPPPMFTPFRLRDLVLTNRVVVSPMCQYVAEDGMPNARHLVHLGSRAIGGGGPAFSETTGVSPGGRGSPRGTGRYRHQDAVGVSRGR